MPRTNCYYDLPQGLYFCFYQTNPQLIPLLYQSNASSYTIYNLLNEQKKKGVAVIFVGEDLDVLIELCDRIMVIGSGKITGVVDGRTAKKEEIGLLMTKTEREGNDE